MEAVSILTRPARKFVGENFKVTTWEALKPYLDRLLERDLNSLDDLKQWFLDRSEIEAVVSEDLGWRYIRMTCFTENQEYRKAYQDFIENIQPQMAPVSDQLNKKAAASPYLNDLAGKEGYDIMIR